MKYTPIIGLEVHVELKTQSKMFCGCSAAYFGEKPNTHTCPVCLGLPGSLPVPNKLAIEWCIKIALALNCVINEFSKFDRKNYFYPDLAKGYQISQYDLPFGYDGFIELKNGKKIGITRVHMEEDTGKLSHQEVNGKRVSLIDFNRSGVPLVEIVTEPDFDNAKDVKEYLEKLQQIVRYLDVSNADMEKGEMRLEPNISLSKIPFVRKNGVLTLPNYKVEVKNINSFKFVEKAVAFEIGRQTELLDANETPAQETRGWDDTKQRTFSQRSKEDAHDYRYFPEPDMPPIITAKSDISRLKDEVPELPAEKIKRFMKKYQLPEYDSEILSRDQNLAEYFENVVRKNNEQSIENQAEITIKSIANFIINKKIDISKTTPALLLDSIINTKKTVQIDEEELEKLITEVISEQSKAVEDYHKGKEASRMFLLGQVMKKLGKKVDTNLVKNIILKKLKK